MAKDNAMISIYCIGYNKKGIDKSCKNTFPIHYLASNVANHLRR